MTLRPNRIRRCREKGRAAAPDRLSNGNNRSAEIAGMSGVDCAPVDLRHGVTDVSDMTVMLQAPSATLAAPVVRLPPNDPVTAMTALDACGCGLIGPLVNSADGARAVVAPIRCPPEGWRSFGPGRGLLCSGPDHVAEADGIFVRPDDLALDLGLPASSDPTEPEGATAQCRVAAKAAGKRVDIFCPRGVVARRRAAEGVDVVVPGNDAHLFKVALAAELRDAKPDHRRAL